MNNLKDIFNKYTTSENIPFYLISRSVYFPVDNPDIYEYTYVSENIPWTIMSYNLYGTIDYWWVLSSLNKDYPFYAKKETEIKYIPLELLTDVLQYI